MLNNDQTHKGYACYAIHQPLSSYLQFKAVNVHLGSGGTTLCGDPGQSGPGNSTRYQPQVDAFADFCGFVRGSGSDLRAACWELAICLACSTNSQELRRVSVTSFGLVATMDRVRHHTLVANCRLPEAGAAATVAARHDDYRLPSTKALYT